MELRISVSYLYFTVVPFHPPRNSNFIYQVKTKNLLIIGKNSIIGSDRSDTIDSSRMHCFPIEFCEIFSIVYINYRLPIKFKQNLSDEARIREIVKWSYCSQFQLVMTRLDNHSSFQDSFFLDFTIDSVVHFIIKPTEFGWPQVSGWRWDIGRHLRRGILWR